MRHTALIRSRASREVIASAQVKSVSKITTLATSVPIKSYERFSQNVLVSIIDVAVGVGKRLCRCDVYHHAD